MRSALTAALEKREPSSWKPKELDKTSFPCLYYDVKSDVNFEDGKNFQDVKQIRNTQRASLGTRPASYVLENGSLAMDYPINPHRRRGGQETLMPASKQSSMNSGGFTPYSIHANLLSLDVIGSLPQGLDPLERDEIFKSTPTTNSLQRLSNIPEKRYTSRTVEAQKLKRQALQNAPIVFITAGYSGKRFIYEKAHELGVKSIIIDGPESWSQVLEKEGIIDMFIPVDLSETNQAFDSVLAAVMMAKKQYGDIAGITTFCEMAVPIVCRISERLGLPGNSVDSVEAARDKFETRTRLHNAGLPSPRHFLIENQQDLKKASQQVGFPAVIKPICGAASIGVIRVDNYEQLQNNYVKVVKELAQTALVDGALQQIKPEDVKDKHINPAKWIRVQIMMEEYLDGDEVDCDVLMSNGECVYGAVTDNWPTIEPYFNETGSNSPSILSLSKQHELMSLAVESVNTLGLTQGTFHVELKYTTRGPRLIEVNCRMGGGPVRLMNYVVWGVDLVEEHLYCSIGISTRPNIKLKPQNQVAEFTVNALKTGKLTKLDFLEQVKERSDILYANYLVDEGVYVTSSDDGLPTWLAEMMVTGPTVDDAINKIHTIVKTINPKIEAIKN